MERQMEVKISMGNPRVELEIKVTLGVKFNLLSCNTATMVSITDVSHTPYVNTPNYRQQLKWTDMT